MEGGRQVDCDDRIPFFYRKILDICDMLDTGIVHQKIDAAEFFGCEFHHRLDLRRLGHVGIVIGGAHVKFLGDARLQFLDFLGITKSVEQNICALGCNFFCNSQANSRGGTGNECGLTFKDVSLHDVLYDRKIWGREMLVKILVLTGCKMWGEFLILIKSDGKMTQATMKSVQCISPAGLHKMVYKEWGDPGNPRVLVCVHGVTRVSDDFDNLARELSR